MVHSRFGFIFSMLFFGLSANLSGADLYVSLKGSDGNPGTKQKPFATLERARDAARSMKHDSTITVWLRGGTYLRSDTFTLSAADSGAASAPVVYRAVPGETARLFGGKALRGFKKWRGPILRADLPRLGVTNFGEMSARGFGRSHVAGLELFFAGRPMPLARWPNRGWAHLSAATPPNSTDQFAFEGDRPARWMKSPDAWVYGYWTYDWADSYQHVASIDMPRHTIRTDGPPPPYGYKAGQRWRVVNVLEELDEPGEWYLDRASGTLYFWPPAPLRSAEADVSLLEKPLVALIGASYVDFRDLKFEVARGDAIVITGGTHDVISHCLIANIGNRAVSIKGGSADGVEDSEIRGTGDGGILLEGGDRKTLTPAGHFAIRNHIHDFSRWSRTYAPAIQIRGVGNRAVGNTVDHAPHNAVLINGNDHLIEHNDLHTVAMETGDVGGYYLGRDWTERGNTVRGNFFHNLGTGDVNAVYLDDCASGSIITDNVIRQAHRGVMIGGGRDNLIENNKFLDCDISIHFDARGLGWARFWFDGRDSTLFDRLGAMPYQQEPWRSRYPQLLTLTRDDPAVPKGNVIRNNLAWSKTWIAYYDHMTERNLILIDNSVNLPPAPLDSTWVKGMGLDIDTPVIARRLTRLTPTSAKLTIENQGSSTVSGSFDVWIDPQGAAKLRTPAEVPFTLQPGEKSEAIIEIDRPVPVVLGVELRGEGLAPEGIRMEDYHPRSH
jgi:parallel beta-helix repeat protein